MNKAYSAILMVIAALGSGCASIVTGHNQSVSVETRAKEGQTITGAYCRLTNNKGTWFVTTPGSVSVRRSYDDMIVNCDKTGLEPGIASVKSSTKAMAFGNIIFGGVIGAGVDVASGAAYDYPTLFTVMMGDSVVIDAPPVDNASGPQAGAPAPAALASTGQPPETKQ